MLYNTDGDLKIHGYGIYVVCNYLINSLVEDFDYDLKKNFISFILTVILFPMIFIIIEKITLRFKGYDE